ncbi:hypothetical protein JXJ21_07650 [candidate division KSB1 bacterium]|nr:hypothetical protein [candidate division KSB1 bacterium]
MTVPPTYYFPWEGIEDFSTYHYDSKGCPRVDYGKKLGLRYNPVTIAQYGLFNSDLFSATGEKRYLNLASTMADWLLENRRDGSHGAAVWYYDFDIEIYKISAPWISAMAQGEAISLLLRANLFSPNQDYLEIAQKASRVFFHSVSDGGVCASFPDGSISLEEFPSDPPSHVLNGGIMALLGVYDLFLHSRDSDIEQVFHQAIDGLRRNLQRYDTGFWTRYDLHASRRLASAMYHDMHVRLMKILWQITDDLFFMNYARKWESYLKQPVSRVRWLLAKLGEKTRHFFKS